MVAIRRTLLDTPGRFLSVRDIGGDADNDLIIDTDISQLRVNPHVTYRTGAKKRRIIPSEDRGLSSRGRSVFH